MWTCSRRRRGDIRENSSVMSSLQFTLSQSVCSLSVTVIIISCLFTTVDGQSCPSQQFTTVQEDQAVGSVIFNLTISADVNVTITSKTSRDDGYLSLRYVSTTTAQVVLEKPLNLLHLNPTNPPEPVTDENITCPARNVTAVTPQPTKKDVTYIMTCYVQMPNQLITSDSDMIIAIEDVNDNAPFFMCSPYYKTINELTPVGTTIFTMSGLAADVDIDGGIYSFDVASGSEGKFTLSGGGSDGYIVVTDDIDYDDGKTRYALNITVKDLGEPPLSNWTYLYINIADGDDLNPVFSNNVYSLSLLEQNTNIINKRFTTVPPIFAYDQDRGINNSVSYVLLSGHIPYGTRYFDIDATTGEIIPLHVLDRNNISTFEIQLKAFEVGKETSRTAFSLLTVTVVDVNNHRPQMVLPAYTASIPENSPDGHLVVQVAANDEDDGVNAEFEFVLVDTSGAFVIDRQSGQIRVQDSSKLDREAQAAIIMTVFAEETRTVERYRSDNVTVTVTLLDINDNSPRFQPSSMYNFYINKASAAGSLVGMVYANDSDASANGEVRYSLLFATENGPSRFQINQTSGAIYTLGSLEEPYVRSYVLTVQAEDQSDIISHRRSSVAGVTVNVTSSNQNVPVFIGEPYSAYISEASPPGTTVINIAAEDVDSNDPLSFHILDEESQLYFECQTNNVMENSVHVVTRAVLDREKISQYYVQLGVSDGRNMVNTTLNVTVLDENDNDPRFERQLYSFNLTEEQEAGVVIGRVAAHDADTGQNADLLYAIRDEWIKDFLSINVTTGEISSARPIDREQWPSLTLEVTATDQGQHSRSGFTVVNVTLLDINDHSPVFVDEPYVVSIAERSQPENFFAVKSVDVDSGENAETRYAIVTGNTSLFSIDSVTGQISALTQIDITEPSDPVYHNLTVMAYNTRSYEGHNQGSLQNATVSVVIHIQDVNDNVPVFSMDVYHVTMPENQTVGQSVARVQATDVDQSPQNSQLTYWLSGGQDANSFRVDRYTGVVTLWDMVNRDFPANKTHCFIQVTASNLIPDHTNRSVIHNVTCTVNITILDVNDNAPVFSQGVYTVHIPENASNQSAVFSAIHAVDIDQNDNGRVIYHLTNQNVPFAIDRDTGELYVTEALDHESGNTSYVLHVQAQDGGHPVKFSSADVVVSIVNVNDNAPVFSSSSYAFLVEENKALNSYVGTVTASDADGDMITYQIQDGNATEFFSIDSAGVIATKFRLDREARPVFVFNVTAQDSGSDGTSHVVMATITVTVIDTNDNIPSFSVRQYNVSIQELQAQHVIKVEATDRDSGVNGHVTYSILSGNEAGIFVVNKTSGDIYVEKPDLLDYTTATEHMLTVQAQDGGDPALASLTSVHVTVIDVNNHNPVFSQQRYLVSVPENRAPRTYVAQVTASDKDTMDKLRFTIISGNNNFFINNETGIVYTSMVLDREATALYHVNISVSDGIHVSYAVMDVQILDVNDNYPRFDKQEYARSLGQDTPIGRSILQVVAMDADFGNNGTVTHWISGTDGKFEIDYNTGVIKVAGKLDYTVKSRYEMRVFARDLGWPVSLISNVSVTININDTNMHPPEFLNFTHDADIAEDAPLNTTVITVVVYDVDEGIAGQTELSIVAGNEDNTFQILPEGNITLEKTLDYEKKKYYELLVEARDRAESSLTSTTRVRISVTDVNDNPPLFVPAPSEIFLKNPVDVSTVVYQFLATDADSDHRGNNNVTYALMTNGVPFEMDQFSGELKTTGLVNITGYPLIITAKDQGKPQLNSSFSFTVNIIDGTNSDIPVFSPRFYTGTNNASVTSEQLIADVDATVQSNNVDSGIYYNISGGLGMEYYTIDAANGIITTQGAVTSSSPAFHSLVISAHNANTPSKYSQTGVLIKLLLGGANLHAPYFPFTQYAADVEENTAVNTQVITLTARDEDQDALLTYSVIEDDSEETFQIETQNNRAVISLNKSPDCEAMPTQLNNIYTLKIAVSDGTYQATTSLLIKISDVNDNSPSFPRTQYNTTASENIGPCEEIVQVLATDADLVDERQLTYSIVAGNDEGKFQISNTSGMISRNCDAASRLDRETTQQYHLLVSVEDSIHKNATAVVQIKVSDENDESPEFQGEPYTAVVREGAASLSVQVNLTAVDRDADENGRVKLDITSGNSDGEFHLSSISQPGRTEGRIHIIKQLDREKAGVKTVNGTAVYELVVMATDEGRTPLSSSTTVTIYVTDVNDNAPVFERSQYIQSISEGTPVGTAVTTLVANDLDLPETTNITYSIDAEGNNGTFSVGFYSGEIVVEKTLAITKQPNYNLTVRAFDGLFYAKTSLRILLVDINDHDPVFSQPVYHFNATENDSTGTLNQVVGIVSATDLDFGINGEVTYEITSRNSIGRFAIENATEGKITVTGTLDRETYDKFTLVVMATDRGIPSRMGTCEVEVSILDVNDNAPQFEDDPYRGSVSEHAAAGTAVFIHESRDEFPPIRASDRDIGVNAVIRYSLSGPGSNLFHVDPVSGAASVKTDDTTLLNRETQATYDLQIVATDRNGTGLSSTASLSITLTDINDHAPEFVNQPYHFDVSESSPPNFYVGRLVAEDGDIDPNNRTQYAISGGSDAKFYIDKLTGELFVTGGLDREVKDTYIITITAQDGGVNPGPLEGHTNVTVTITDANDNYPVFLSNPLQFSVSESAVPGFVVGAVEASDVDLGSNGRIRFFNNDSVPFQVNEASGELSTSTLLDRESRADYIFSVFASDNGNPPLVSMATIYVVISDANDNAPEFEQAVYSVNILEKQPVDSVIALTRAHDADAGDNANITYSLRGRNGSEKYFYIDPAAGLVRIAQRIDKTKLVMEGILRPGNSSADSTMEIKVFGADAGMPVLTGNASLFIKVDEINDDNPVFTNVTYSAVLPEEVPEGTSVITVKATTRDSTTEIRYAVLNSDMFLIKDSLTGLIATAGERLDRESRDRYTFTVQAVDNRIPQRTAFTTVSVLLTDINDNRPTFLKSQYHFSASEAVYTDHVVGVVSAVDADSGQNQQLQFSIVSGNEGNMFSIDDAGQIKVSGDLDREVTAQYKLNITVSDKGQPSLSSSCEAVVTVLDKNDQSPVFTNAPYYASVAENLPGGQQVVIISASDNDAGLNGAVFIELANQNTSEVPFYFQNKGGYGILRTLTSLDYEKVAAYNLTLVASDLGSPPRSSYAWVSVSVLDMMDNLPQFASDLYEVTKRENTSVGALIITVDAGEGASYYNITDGNPDETFTLNHTSGVLYLNKPLSLSRRVHELTVMACDDKMPPNKASTKVRVLVTSSSPRPEFDQSVYTVTYDENQGAPRVLIDLNSTDELMSAPVTYTIIAGGNNGLFSIEAATGKLWCNAALDRETQARYIVTVQCDFASNQVTTNRRKRAATEPVNVVDVVVSVGDVNDNAPYFPVSPITAGVTADASFNTYVTTVQASDADTGNNSAIWYVISGGEDRDSFYINSLTGQLFSKTNIGRTQRREFLIKVNATDNWGQGHSTATDVKIVVLSDSERVILVAKVSPTDFRLRQDGLIKNLSTILGWQVHPEKIEAHVEDTADGPSVDVTRTDFYFYAIDTTTSSVVPRELILQRMQEKAKEIEELFRTYDVDEVKGVTKTETYAITASVVALIIIACIVFFGSVLAMFVVCYSWKQRERERKRSEQLYRNIQRHGNLNPLQLTNPLFVEAEQLAIENGQPLQLLEKSGPACHQDNQKEANMLVSTPTQHTDVTDVNVAISNQLEQTLPSADVMETEQQSTEAMSEQSEMDLLATVLSVTDSELPTNGAYPDESLPNGQISQHVQNSCVTEAMNVVTDLDLENADLHSENGVFLTCSM